MRNIEKNGETEKGQQKKPNNFNTLTFSKLFNINIFLAGGGGQLKIRVTPKVTRDT